MSDELVGAGTQEATNGEAPSEVSAAPVAPEAPSATPGQFDADAYLSSLSDVDRAKVIEKHYGSDINRRIDQGVNKRGQKLEAEYKEKLAKNDADRTYRQQLAQSVTYLDNLMETNPAEVTRQFKADPGLAKRYAEAKEILATNPGAVVDQKALADKYYADFKKTLTAEEGFEDINIDEIEPGQSPGEFLANVAKARLAKERKAMQDDFKKEMQAAIAGELAKLHKGAEEPGKLPPGGGNSRRYSAAAVQKMSTAEYLANQEAIDAAFDNGWIDP